MGSRRSGRSAQLFGATANNSSALYVTEDQLDIPRIGDSLHGELVAALRVRVRRRRSAAGNLDFGRIAAEAAAVDELVEVQRQTSASALVERGTDGVEEAY